MVICFFNTSAAYVLFYDFSHLYCRVEKTRMMKLKIDCIFNETKVCLLIQFFCPYIPCEIGNAAHRSLATRGCFFAPSLNKRNNIVKGGA